MEIKSFCAAFLIILAAVPVQAENPYYTDGAGLNGDIIAEIPVPAKQIDITTMNLSNSLDLSDNSDIDDSVAINEAIGKISKGQALYLPDGIYNLSSVINLKSGKSIVGESRDNTVLKVKDGTTGAVIKGDTVTNCVVENMTLTSDWTGQYSLSTTNKNPDVGQMKFGLLLYSAEGIVARNLMIEKFNTAGIAVCAGNNCRLENNTILNATDLSGDGHGYGILLQDRNGNGNGVTKSVLEGNYLKGPYLRHGVLLQAFSNHNEIKNNQFEEIRLDSIDLHGEGEHHNEIAENKIFNGGEAGVGVGNGPIGTHGASGPYNYIHDNEIDKCVYGITVMLGTQNTIISENNFSSSVKTGVRMRCSDLTVVYGNTFTDMPSALLFQRESDDIGSSVHTTFENNNMQNVETACMIEKNAAENEMFSVISGNSGTEDEFISVTPSDDSYLTIAAGYSDSGLAEINMEIGENAVLPDKVYSKISYFQWEPWTLKPECDSIVLYDVTK